MVLHLIANPVHICVGLERLPRAGIVVNVDPAHRGYMWAIECGFPSDANQDTATKEPILVPMGLVTRARAKRFKESLNGLIQSIWTEINSWRPKDDVIHGPQGWISII